MELCDLRPIQDAAREVFASCKVVHTLFSSCFSMCLVLFSLHEYPNAVLKSLRTVGVFHSENQVTARVSAGLFLSCAGV